MKKAFVNCRIMPGGVLNVFVDMIESEKFTESKIFTIFSDRDYLQTSKGKIEIVTALPTRLNKIFLKYSQKPTKKGIIGSIFDYRNLMFFYRCLMRILSKKIERYKSPKVIISSFAIAKNLEFCKDDYTGVFNPIVSLYLHSPMQYIRSHHKEYIDKLNGYKLKIFKYITPKLKNWDQKYIKFDKVYSNSKYTAKLAKEIYNISTTVKYPKVDVDFLHTEINPSPQNYYIYVGRLVRFVKEVEKIIKLFNETQQPLLIMGSGPDEQYLKSISKGNIIFIGRISDPQEKINIIKNSKGLINITKESFGLGTVEALLLGVPVFAYSDGASPEFVDNSDGLLVTDKKHKTLQQAFEKFQNTNWDRKQIQDNINIKLKKYPR